MEPDDTHQYAATGRRGCLEAAGSRARDRWGCRYRGTSLAHPNWLLLVCLSSRASRRWSPTLPSLAALGEELLEPTRLYTRLCLTWSSASASAVFTPTRTCGVPGCNPRVLPQ